MKKKEEEKVAEGDKLGLEASWEAIGCVPGPRFLS